MELCTNLDEMMDTQSANIAQLSTNVSHAERTVKKAHSILKATQQSISKYTSYAIEEVQDVISTRTIHILNQIHSKSGRV